MAKSKNGVEEQPVQVVVKKK